MAEKRMFSQKIIDSDAFLDMPLSSQCLYFHLSMRADDDGFVSNPNKITRIIGANKNDYDLLVVKRFILVFESGVIVIKHWKINNYLRGDRYKPTVYLEEKSLLVEKENGSYSFGIPSGIPLVDADKSRLDESSIDIDENSLDVSTKVSKEINASVGGRTYPRESYEEIMIRLGLSEHVREYFFKFIQFQQANKKIVTNDMLEKTIRGVQGAAERRVRHDIPGSFIEQLNADLSYYQNDIDTFICEAIQQALNGQWFEIKEPKEFKTAAEWEAQAEEDMKLWGLK